MTHEHKTEGPNWRIQNLPAFLCARQVTERWENRMEYNRPFIRGERLQDPQWMPETSESSQSYTYCVLSYTYIHVYDEV